MTDYGHIRMTTQDGEVTDLPSAKKEKDFVNLNPAGPATQNKEQVLVFPSSLVAFAEGFEKSPLLTDPETIRLYLDEIMGGGELAFIDRDHAETDEDFLQVIPYTVLFLGREVFCYRRTKAGAEGRLHDRWSLGVGGHINPTDGDAGVEAFTAGYWRELCEEVSIDLPPADLLSLSQPVGLIYDDSEPLGRVHFGIVFVQNLPRGARLTFKDPALADGEFRHQSELRHLGVEFENWSKLLIGKFFS